jgi:hypothetical protein
VKSPFWTNFSHRFRNTSKPQRPYLSACRLDSRCKVQRFDLAQLCCGKLPDQRLRLIQSIGQFTQPPRAIARAHISWYSNHINPPAAIAVYHQI